MTTGVAAENASADGVRAAFDTSSGAAVAVVGGGRLLFAGRLPLAGRESDGELARWLEGEFNRAGIRFRDVAAWTVGTGPGSFSGLRAGISLVGGLAAAAGAPVCGVPSSLALARAAVAAAGCGADATPDDVCVLHDARQRQLIVSIFRFEAGLWRELQPARVMTPEQAASAAADCWLAVTCHVDRIRPLLSAPLLQKLDARAGVEAEWLLDAPGWPVPADDAARAASCQPIYVRPAVFVPPAPVREA